MPFDHFDIIAGIYNRTAQFSAPPELLEVLNLPFDGLLLDAGGGTGRVAESLRKMVRQVFVADISRGMLKHASVKSLLATCAPVEKLPFASGVIDRVIMVDALHHVFDQEQAILELWRVLAPGGRIVIIEPNIHKFGVKLIAVAEKILLMRSHFLPAERIVALFADQNPHIWIVSNEGNVWVCAEKVR
jgi:ubiquinone/menaquinone biosynthesis C-methylase UbiE